MLKRQKEVKYLVEKVLNNPWSTIRIYSITPGSEFKVTGLIQSGLSIYGNNTFDTPLDGKMPLDVLQQSTTDIRASMQMLGMQGTQMSMVGKSLISTVKTYSNSTIPSFMLNFILVAIRPGDSVLDWVTKLHACVLPRYASKTLIAAPLGYSGVDAADDFRIRNDGEDLESKIKIDSGTGTLNVAFSKYFFGTGLVCRDMNYQLSEQNGLYGPLFATVSMTFEPKRMITISEFRNYFARFIKPEISNTNNSIKQTLEASSIVDLPVTLAQIGVSSTSGVISDGFGLIRDNVTTKVEGINLQQRTSIQQRT